MDVIFVTRTPAVPSLHQRMLTECASGWEALQSAPAPAVMQLALLTVPILLLRSVTLQEVRINVRLAHTAIVAKIRVASQQHHRSLVV
jgi:hypothetical protein